MATINEVFGKIEDVGKKAGKAVIGASEKVKIGYNIFSAENELSSLYTLLGKDAAESWADAPAEIMEKITAIKEKIAELKEQQQGAAKRCAECGAKVSDDSVYCFKCGHKID